jgi:hypothetical protein
MQDGDQLQVLYDGTQVPPSAGSGATIQQPVGGAHSIGAFVRGADGNVRCNASPVTFYVRRASILSPQSPQANSPARH